MKNKFAVTLVLSLFISRLMFDVSLLFSQESWMPTSLVNAPIARDNQTAVWTGSKMIIWGGYYYNTGGIFDPVANSWITTSTTNAPLGRGAHSAVWTGTKMIIWGGASGNVYNTGGIYDPITSHWAATTTTNAPSPRMFHSAVWSGNMMIIWGGEISNGVTNTGAKYDPVNDSWIPTSTTNAPDARYLQSCVWTGSKLIVWGGCSSNGLTLYNTGGIYDPVSDTWIATSTVNAPLARCTQRAVWTGSKMIIWGGTIGINSNTNTGGIYDPSTDSWTATSTNDAPSERSSNTAIWTGTKMIVWGGGGSTLVYSSGGIYDPVQNSWTATSISNAPEQRVYHTAIWTGTKMIVWGGNDSTMLNTGGIYSNPSVIGIHNISENVPGKFFLYQNYPNPFNPSTTIRFDLPQSANVTIKLYDVIGRVVLILANEIKNAGEYELKFDGSNIASGVYFYQLEAGTFRETKKMLLIK